MTWTQPVCQRCWNRENPNRSAAKMVQSEPEMCCLCGDETVDGIYVRKDPVTVPFPRKDG